MAISASIETIAATVVRVQAVEIAPACARLTILRSAFAGGRLGPRKECLDSLRIGRLFRSGAFPTARLDRRLHVGHGPDQVLIDREAQPRGVLDARPQEGSHGLRVLSEQSRQPRPLARPIV